MAGRLKGKLAVVSAAGQVSDAPSRPPVWPKAPR